MKLKIENIHEEVKSILRKGEEIFREGFFGKTEVYDQGGIQLSTSVVTKTDKDLDAFFRKKLKQHFPEIGFITEEEKGKQKITKQLNWIIDPIDGTANFAHKIPICGISIALWKNDEPIYGIVSLPMLHEIIYAFQGEGIFYNRKKIKRAKEQITPTPYIVYNHVGTSKEKLKVYQQISKVIPFPVDYYCSIFSGNLVALGRADCWIVINLPIWDFAAILLFTKEAGLHIEFVSPPPSIKKKNLREYNNTFVVGRKELAVKVANKVREALKKIKQLTL